MEQNQMKQTAKEESVALQAGGDINVGLSYPEVKEIVYDLFEKNFPSLVEKAESAAKDNVDEYFKILEEGLKKRIDQLNMEKFEEPNTQFMLNDSIKAAARYGNRVDFGMLSETLISSLKRGSSEMLEIVASQALEIIPRITERQIGILTVIHYVYSMKLLELPDFASSEPSNKIVADLTSTVTGSEDGNKSYLGSIGALSIVNFRGGDIYDIVKSHYDYLFSGLNKEQVKSEIAEKSPSMKLLIDRYNEFNGPQIDLMPVGKLIALINLRRIFQDLDYSIWIK